MRRIDTAIDIAAAPAIVWKVLVDFAAYPDWNPFVRRIEGEARADARLTVTIQPPGAKAMGFRPIVQTCTPGRELHWLGRVLMPGLFDGEHSFRIEPTAGGCRLHHAETFGGLLVPLFGGMLDTTAQGFAAMNTALKARAEARA